MADTTWKIGDKVRWVSSGVPKEGVISHVIPAGSRLPMGIKAGGGGVPRDHESYVIRARPEGRRGEFTGRPANYWPYVSLLTRVDGAA